MPRPKPISLGPFLVKENVRGGVGGGIDGGDGGGGDRGAGLGMKRFFRSVVCWVCGEETSRGKSLRFSFLFLVFLEDLPIQLMPTLSLHPASPLRPLLLPPSPGLFRLHPHISLFRSCHLYDLSPSFRSSHDTLPPPHPSHYLPTPALNDSTPLRFVHGPACLKRDRLRLLGLRRILQTGSGEGTCTGLGGARTILERIVFGWKISCRGEEWHVGVERRTWGDDGFHDDKATGSFLGYK